MSTYFNDKSNLQRKELSDIKQKSHTAAKKVAANRRSYAKLKTLSEKASIGGGTLYSKNKLAQIKDGQKNLPYL